MNDDMLSPVRLFPLPNLVFFPHVRLPLHIFEPRYRQMTADALAGDRLIAMVMLQPGWEPEYDAAPAIYPVACLGRIVVDHRLEDGRYNLILQGLSRIRLLDEVQSDRLYRTARAHRLHDQICLDGTHDRRLREQLKTLSRAFTAENLESQEQLERLFSNDLPLGMLTDILGFALNLTAEEKQPLLEELDVAARANLLLATLTKGISGRAGPAGPKYPPEFSPN